MINGRVRVRMVDPISGREDVVVSVGEGWYDICSDLVGQLDEYLPGHGTIVLQSSAILGYIDLHLGAPRDEYAPEDVSGVLHAVETAQRESMITCESCGSLDGSIIQQPHALRKIVRCDECLAREFPNR